MGHNYTHFFNKMLQIPKIFAKQAQYFLLLTVCKPNFRNTNLHKKLIYTRKNAFLLNLKPNIIKIMRNFLFLAFVTVKTVFLTAQTKTDITPNNKGLEYTIHWEGIKSQSNFENETHKYLTFQGAEHNHPDNYLPRYNLKIEVPSVITSFSASIVDGIFSPLTEEEASFVKNSLLVHETIITTTAIAYSKKQPYGRIDFLPFRKNSSTGKLEKLIAFNLRIVYGEEQKNQNRSAATYASSSVLQSGVWYKLAVSSSGIHKLTYAFLQNLGIDMTTLNPQNIRIYGTGGLLPELNSQPKIDDLTENAIFVQGESDGVFNLTDYALFYAKGPVTWTYNPSACSIFNHQKHTYSDTSYYFLTVDLGAGKRIQTQASSSLAATNTVTAFNDYAYHENDNTNFLKSGKLWVGEYFDNIASYNFSFSFPNIVMTAPVSVKTSIASRYIASSSSTANYLITSQSGSTTMPIGATSGGTYDVYANIGTACYSFNPSNPVITVNVTKQTSSAIAWLDYLELNVRRNLIMSGTQLAFRDVESVGVGNVADYNITSNSAIQVWDVTDIANVKSQILNITGTTYQFRLPSDNLNEFVAFSGSTFNTPLSGKKIENQNLHANTNKQYLIVTHPDFYQQALELATYRENRDTISTLVVTTEQIYNEFSSGARDASAIRNFVKMFYDRASLPSELPKYLLLYGDGSYDNKGNHSGNTNFVPTYQSAASTVLTTSYVSDDYYGLLDDNEGVWINDAVDIGIGRFPVKTVSEAKAMNNKLFNYEKTGFAPASNSTACTSGQVSSSPFGDWRNIISFVADDEDGSLHTNQADSITRIIKRLYKSYNVDKIYLDSYIQEATPGGKRYPAANEALDKRVQKGCLIMNYTGHGGELGWAHERVLENSTINAWKNTNNLPLFFTATCEFTRWDDPERTSAGEYVFLNPNGGGIALMTTVRVVYAGPNFNLNLHYFNNAFTPLSNGKMPTLGDVYEYMKNQYDGYIVNGRNFTLVGDPAMRLAYPKYNVSTDTVNTTPVTTSSSDTVRALSLVTVSGYVRNSSGNILTTYNGVLYPTVFDKPQKITTLSNDGVSSSPPINFLSQKNILYKGKVSVTNGFFKFSFIVPKDIAYQYGAGKISYYAENGTEDANGYYEQIIIGGSDTNALADNVGPEVMLYLNDDKFVFGGITDENPDLYAKIKDENGINTVGNGIGHDITATLDVNTANAVVLNDYYQADLNSYKSGTIRYPYSNLTEGKHTLTLKVWDVHNNSSKSYTEFIVAKSADMALSHVLNYPNPFTTKTQFYFEHNQCCQTLEVQLQIFTVSGKLVKTITQFVAAEGNRSDPISWDGRDDYGDKIGRGVYLYKLKVKTSEGATAEKIEKLVILN